MAYSTLSQLGYMFVGLGSGIVDMHHPEHSLATFAVVAAMFHLFTHAFFKALLFLSSGSVMHAMGGIIDMRRFSGLRKVMPITHWTFLCGAGALAGIPLLSGFWSKDEIIAATYAASEIHGDYHVAYLTLFISSMLTAALTAFYTFRAYFLTFWGELRVPEEAYSHAHGGGHGGHDDKAHGGHGDHAPAPSHHGGHGHDSHAAAHDPASHHFESPPIMTWPLIILAVFAVGVGGVLGPTHLFAHFLESTPGLLHHATEPEGGHWIMPLSGLIALLGLGLAYLMYVRQPELPGKLARSMQTLYQVSREKFYFDELYYAFVVHPLAMGAALARTLDYFLVDGLIDLIGNVPRLLGYLFRPVQNGLVQFYALAMVLSLAVLLLSLVYYL
jgi:NADH-quinone oxidoreductase subunit L